MGRRLTWLLVGSLLAAVSVGGFLYARSGESLGKVSPVDDVPAVRKWTDRGSLNKLPSGPEVAQGRFEYEGISVDFSMTRVTADEDPRTHFVEGDDVRFRFRITDSSGAPLTDVYPAAWLVSRSAGSKTSQQVAAKKAQALVNASTLSPADLDLNIYYVVTLNDNATITVVDPLFSYGGTKLLALIPLKSTGVDWVLTADGSTMFVSLPESHEIAVIDTEKWEVREYVPGGVLPERLALQSDEHYLWVGGGGQGKRADDSGVTVLNTSTLEVAARIRTGRGRHDIAISDDNRFAFITNSESDTVSVVDVRTLKKRGDVPTGKTPVSIDYSAIAGVAWASHSGDGTVTAISAEKCAVVSRLQADKGLGQIRFAPGDRLGFVVNPERDSVHIVDAASSRIAQTGRVPDGPDQIAFSDNLAYIRRRASAEMQMVPLDAVGVEGKNIPILGFPAGQNAPGATRRCLAPAMVQAPGASAMLVANASDQTVYFYKEGMAAPMGTFNNYRRDPLAVAVVDRSLRERSDAGVYDTVARLDTPGSYDAIFFLNAPRLVHSFPVEIEEDEELKKARNAGKFDVTYLAMQSRVQVGRKTEIRFRITDRNSGQERRNLDDVTLQTHLLPSWYERFSATEIESGLYAVDFTPAETGTYYVSVASDSLGLTYSDRGSLVLRAVESEPPGNTGSSSQE